MSLSWSKLLVVTMLPLLLVGCPSPDAPEEHGLAPTREALDEFASALYDHAQEARQDPSQAEALKEDVRLAIQFMGLPLVSSAPPDEEFLQRMSSPEPVFFDFEPTLISSGLTSGIVVTLPSLVNELNSLGFRTKGTSEAITLQYLTQVLTPLAEKSNYTPEERPLALILALGRERARRSEGLTAEPVFGDGSMDPLQLTIFLKQLLPIYAAARQAAPIAPSPIVPVTAGQRKSALNVGAGATFLLEHGGTLSTALDLGQKAVARALVMFGGTRLGVSGTPTDVWHKRAGVPSVSNIEGSITYEDFVKGDLELRLALRAADVQVPPTGPLAGEDVFWGVSPVLEKHGELTEYETKTDAAGKTTTSFNVTRVEDTPERDWVKANERQEEGLITMQAVGLIKDFERLEASFLVKFYGGVDGIEKAAQKVKVLYYEGKPHLNGTITVVSERKVDLDQSFQTTRYDTTVRREITVDVSNVGEDGLWSDIVNLHSSATAVWDYEYHAQVTSGCEVLRSDITGAGSSSVSQQVDVDYAFHVDPVSLQVNQLELSFPGPPINISGVRQGRHTAVDCDGTTHESEVGIPWEDTLADGPITIIDTVDPTSPLTIRGTKTIERSDPPSGVEVKVTITWDLTLGP